MKNPKKLEQYLFYIKMQKFEFHQEKIAIKIEQINELREIDFKERQERFEERNKKFKQTLKRNVFQETQRLLNYFEKKSIIQKRKDEIEEMKNEEKEYQRNQYHQKLQNIKETIMTSKIKDVQERENKKERFIETDLKIKAILEKREWKNLLKTQNNILFRTTRHEKVKQIARIKEYELSNLSKKLMEKSQTIEDFQKERCEIARRKREISFELNEKKLTYLQNYNNIMNKKELNVIKIVD